MFTVIDNTREDNVLNDLFASVKASTEIPGWDDDLEKMLLAAEASVSGSLMLDDELSDDELELVAGGKFIMENTNKELPGIDH